MIRLQIPGITDTSVPADSIAAQKAEKLQELKSLSFEDLINKLANDIVQFTIHLAIAILVFYVGKFIIKRLYNIVETVMLKRRIDRSLTTFVLSLVKIVLYFILIVTVISIIGIETSSFIAIFASAGVAIGMALSGTLQNFAGGVLILLLKPYKIGDYIETQGLAGTVTEIQIFNTIISTPDNKSIIVPNGGLSTGTINNWSRQDYRRVEWTVSISYGNSVEAARTAVINMMKDDPDIVHGSLSDHRRLSGESELESAEKAAEAEVKEEKKHGWLWRLFHHQRKAARQRLQELEESRDDLRQTDFDTADRSPVVNLGNLGESSVDLTIRAWVPTSSYWAVYYRYNERFYNELPQAGVEFPFPQLDVHLPQK